MPWVDLKKSRRGYAAIQQAVAWLPSFPRLSQPGVIGKNYLAMARRKHMQPKG